MKTSTSLRSLLIAVPVMTLMACSSGPSETELAAERNRVAAEQAAAQQAAQQANQEQVRMEAAQRLQQAQEMAQQERDSLVSMQTIYFDWLQF